MPHESIPEMPREQPEIPVGMLGTSGRARVIEYAPGKRAVIMGLQVVPRYGIVRFEHVGRGEWQPRIVGWGQQVALRRFFRPGASGNEPHPVLQCLGLDLSYNSVLRLYKAGFISGSQPVPNRILIDLSSLSRHLTEAADPEFWTEERCARFREVMR